MQVKVRPTLPHSSGSSCLWQYCGLLSVLVKFQQDGLGKGKVRQSVRADTVGLGARVVWTVSRRPAACLQCVKGPACPEPYMDTALKASG